MKNLFFILLFPIICLGQVHLNNNSVIIQSNGTIIYKEPILAKAVNYTATLNDLFFAVTNGAANDTIFLPDATTCTGKSYNVKKVDAGVGQTIIKANGVQTIDGSNTNAITAQWESVMIKSDGANWLIY